MDFQLRMFTSCVLSKHLKFKNNLRRTGEDIYSKLKGIEIRCMKLQ
jgi:hypothetical protein